jgi:hypothetical protein
MKRLVLLSLVAAILSLAGCRWFCVIPPALMTGRGRLRA